jgi:hypothetical protein
LVDFFPEVSDIGPQILQFAGIRGHKTARSFACGMGVFGWRMRNARVSNSFWEDIDLLVGLPHASVLQVDF